MTVWKTSLVVPWLEENIKICFTDLLLSLCSSSISDGMLKFSQADKRRKTGFCAVYVCVNSDSLKWLTWNFSLGYLYIIQQTSKEDTQTY